MRIASVSVVCLLSVAACATGRGRTDDVQVSAAQLGLARCPDDVRAGVPGIDRSADWRQFSESGLRYCVPAAWTISSKQLRRQVNRPNVWWGDGGSFYVQRSRTIEQDFSRAYLGPGTASDYALMQIGGSQAELWTRNRPRPPENDREAHYAGVGYQTFAVWREQGVYFTGGAKRRAAVAVLRRIFQTTRFDSASTIGESK